LRRAGLLNGLQNLSDGSVVGWRRGPARAHLVDRFNSSADRRSAGVEGARMVILTREEFAGVTSLRIESLLLSIGASLMFKAS